MSSPAFSLILYITHCNNSPIFKAHRNKIITLTLPHHNSKNKKVLELLHPLHSFTEHYNKMK